MLCIRIYDKKKENSMLGGRKKTFLKVAQGNKINEVEIMTAKSVFVMDDLSSANKNTYVCNKLFPCYSIIVI